MHYDYVIIGGGIAGATAAIEIRNRDTNGSIAIFGDEPHPVYSRVLLPHVVRGKVPETSAIMPQNKALASGNVVVFSGAPFHVASLDSVSHSITLANGENHTFGKMLIATGGRVKPFDITTKAGGKSYAFQTLDDARELRDVEGGSAVVIGGGFIAIELIMSFVHKNIPITALLRGDQFFRNSLDAKSAARIAEKIRENHVDIITNCDPQEIATKSEAQHVGVGVGITPNVEFLAGSGIDIATGILVNEFLQTSSPDIFAAGDVAECIDPFTGERRIIGNWQNAIFQGKIAGANMATAQPQKYDAVTTYAITIFGLPVLFVGAVETKNAERTTDEIDGAIYQYITKEEKLVGFTCVGPCTKRQELIARITSHTK